MQTTMGKEGCGGHGKMMGYGKMSGHNMMMNGSGEDGEIDDEDNQMMMCPNRKAMQTIHKLLENRHKINRTITPTDDGAETDTSSSDPQVSDWIHEHVAHMIALIQEGGKIRCWDPLFAALTEFNDDFTASPTYTKEGVHVSLNGSTPCTKRLMQRHSHVLSNFLERGQEEVSREHQVPAECEEVFE